MDPNTPQFTPAQPTATPAVAPTARATRDPKFTWGLVCLIGPTTLIILSIVGYALVNLIASSTVSPDAGGAMFGEPSVGTRIGNVILFIVGALAVMSWLPGVIVGIILLATRKK